MKKDQPSQGPAAPMIQPMIDELHPREKEPPQPLSPPQPAELDQDPGGGYNPDHSDPQT